MNLLRRFFSSKVTSTFLRRRSFASGSPPITLLPTFSGVSALLIRPICSDDSAASVLLQRYKGSTRAMLPRRVRPVGSSPAILPWRFWFGDCGPERRLRSRAPDPAILLPVNAFRQFCSDDFPRGVFPAANLLRRFYSGDYPPAILLQRF